jgi:hypothetical protein
VSLHLLVTGFVTDDAVSPASFYGLSEFTTRRIDQLLSTLCSLRKIEFESADFYLDFDNNYQDKKEIVFGLIRSYFSDREIKVFDFRLENFQDWVEAAKKLPSSDCTILLMANLDHAFVHDSAEDFQEFVDFFENLEVSAIGAITHWQEFITEKKVRFFKRFRKTIVFRKPISAPIGTCLVNVEFFRSWWDRDFTNGHRIVRPDNPFGPSVEFDTEVFHYIPQHEFLRHMDGYGHINIQSRYASWIRACCVEEHDAVTHSEWIRHLGLSKKADLPGTLGSDVREYLMNLNSRFYAPWKTWRILRFQGLGRVTVLKLLFLIPLEDSYVRRVIVPTIRYRLGKVFYWKVYVLRWWSKLKSKIER